LQGRGNNMRGHRGGKRPSEEKRGCIKGKPAGEKGSNERAKREETK